MKKYIVVAIFSLCSSLALATDYSACELSYQACQKEASCSSHDICQQQEQQSVNVLVLKSIRELDFEKQELCVEKRSALESDIQARATTIECHDTENGPVFGG